MFQVQSVAQPDNGTNLGMIAAILNEGAIEHLDVAAAYATETGVKPLIETLENGLGGGWATTRKRWILAFDYARTDPAAADRLAGLPQSSVRIVDAQAVIARKGIARRPFHPKTFLFGGAQRQRLFTGSGNLSRSGLMRGHEVGVLLDHKGAATATSQTVHDAITSTQTWFDALWQTSDHYEHYAEAYRRLFASVPNLKAPTPTEDDSADFELSSNALTPRELIKLRICRNLWIEARTLTKNRGKILPGNQIMLKRNTRVFFGVAAQDIQPNSHLATLSISLGAEVKDDCTLTYSYNNMDKLTLPVPDNAVGTYDGKTLIIRRLSPDHYTIDTISGSALAAAKKASAAIDAKFKMSGANPREWGVF